MKPLYKTYAFKNKDPVIDLLRTAIQAEALARGIRFGAVLKWISVHSGVSIGTLYNWFGGTVISPRYCCVAAVANSVRASFRVGETNKPQRKRKPKLRLVA